MENPLKLDVYSPPKIDFDGEERTLRTLVGVAFRHRNGDGYNIVINENIAVSNELVLFPPDSRTDADRDSRPPVTGRTPQHEPATPDADTARRRLDGRHPLLVAFRRRSSWRPSCNVDVRIAQEAAIHATNLRKVGGRHVGRAADSSRSARSRSWNPGRHRDRNGPAGGRFPGRSSNLPANSLDC